MTDDARDARPSLGAALDRLLATVEARKAAAPDTSYTAKLLNEGPRRAAKKFGEEAVELVIAATGEDPAETRAEAADVLYHFAVLLAAADTFRAGASVTDAFVIAGL